MKGFDYMKKISLFETNCTSPLNKLKRKTPYEWDLNIFRGCQHGCIYCYAIDSNKYLENSNFYREIYIKTNIVEKLEEKLKSGRFYDKVINIGGITDSYQPIEAKYRIMPDILKLCIKYTIPIIISTKSDLIMRDIELIDELASKTYVNIGVSLISSDEEIRKKIEPVAVSIKKRLNVVKSFSKTNASIGVHMMPIIPYITDSKENIECIIKKSSENSANYILPGFLYLRGECRPRFFQRMNELFPNESVLLRNLYIDGKIPNYYKSNFYNMFNSLVESYEISTDYLKPYREKMLEIKEKHEHIQMSLFDM